MLRETAQTPEGGRSRSPTDITRHRYFHTNNLWFDLRGRSPRTLEDRGGVLGLPLIRNDKTVDPTDPDSPAVIQIESAMGAIVEVFDGATAIEVDRARFLPVKTTDDLLLLRSDVYDVGGDYHLRRPSRGRSARRPRQAVLQLDQRLRRAASRRALGDASPPPPTGLRGRRGGDVDLGGAARHVSSATVTVPAERRSGWTHRRRRQRLRGASRQASPHGRLTVEDHLERSCAAIGPLPPYDQPLRRVARPAAARGRRQPRWTCRGSTTPRWTATRCGPSDVRRRRAERPVTLPVVGEISAGSARRSRSAPAPRSRS